jgi:hypothetical protein
MIRKTKSSNPIVFRPGSTIGSTSAENDDDFLFECFMHHPAVERCTNLQAPGMILAGRTGSGKTAIIRYIEHEESNVVIVDPSEMALSYIANSDVFRFLDAIDADLNLLFQALWKHVFCIEFIRLRFDIKDETTSRSFFVRLRDLFSQDRRQDTALNYLKEWEGKFWITMDQNIRQITEKLEDNLQVELGTDIQKFKARGNYQKQLSTEHKTELATRARRIINTNQLSDLSKVIAMLHQASDDTPRKFFIMVDKLDEHWVSTDIRFKLIRSLIESLKTFRKIRSLKVLAAIRSDVLERVIQETGDLSFQREKYEEYFVQLRWSEAELKELVQKRIHKLFARQYSGQTVTFENLFQNKVANQDPFKYMISRTLLRPRDIIAFVNSCLELSGGSKEITSTLIKQAEKNYSRVRRQALQEEWKSSYPTLDKLIDLLASYSKEGFLFSDLLNTPLVEELALNIAVSNKIDFDPVHALAQKAVSQEKGFEIFLKEIVSILYLVGAVSLKLRPEERHSYSHLDQPVIDPVIITGTVRIKVHPMLQSTLNIRNNYGDITRNRF